MKNILKKVLAVLTIFLFSMALSSCGSEEGETEVSGDAKAYDGSAFTINVGPDWRTLTKKDFYAEVPEEAVAAFTMPEAYNGFYINVNIVEENLGSELSSIDFGRANMALAAKNLTDYVKQAEDQVDLNGTSALVHTFKARLNPSEKLLTFVQLYTTKNRVGYTVTGAMPADTPNDIQDEVESFVTSFRLK